MDEKSYVCTWKTIKGVKMKKMHLGFLASLLLLMILFSGCKSQEASLFPSVISLKGRMLSIGEYLGRAHSLEAVDDYLILADNHGSLLYTILKPDGSYCFHFGRKGQGPDEMKQLSGAMMIRNGKLTLSDGYRLYQHDLNNLFNSVDSPIPSSNSKSGDTHIWVADLSDSLFIATGVYPNGKRFKFIDNMGTPLAYTGDYPLEEETTLPFYVIGASFLSIMTSHPSSNRFALGTLYGGVLDVMDWNMSDFSLTRVGGISQFVPKLTSKDIQGTPNFVPNEKTRWGYVKLDSDVDYIYGLYSGRFQLKETPYFKGNTVHVFDWIGNPVCQIKLDKDVLDIAVVKNKLYALYEDADIGYEVIEYVLPDNWMKK